MEAATVEHVETSPAEGDTPEKMFNFSDYVHVGPGAAECEHAKDGACEDADHFHGWCRLPNQFERKSLRDKGMAAKARKLRSLADEDSDARVILESELERSRVAGETELLIEEVLNKTFLHDQIQAIKEVAEDAEGDYDTIDEDRERRRALEAKPEEERNEEELAELRTRLYEHTEKVNARRDQIQLPRKQELEARSLDELIDVVRKQRMENVGLEAMNTDWAKWQWHISTFKPKSPDKPGFPNERMWGSIDDFSRAPEEVIRAVSTTIQRLEQESAAKVKGSS